ncbi:MAG: hypothetical protein AB7F59_04315 [Bdellovibrionales bacterium]
MKQFTKKMETHLFSVLLCLTVASPAAFATKEGGGGISVVCRDAGGSIVSAKLLDLAEAREPVYLDYPEGMEFNNLKPTWEEILAEGLKRIQPTDRDYLEYKGVYQEILAEIAHIKLNTRTFKSPSAGPAKTNDFNPRIGLKRGCEFEQFANFQTNGLVMVDGEIRGVLTQLDFAGFYFHEAAYRIAKKRNASIENSDLVREITSLLFTSSPQDLNKLKTKFYEELLSLKSNLWPNYQVFPLTQAVSSLDISAEFKILSALSSAECTLGVYLMKLPNSVQRDAITSSTNRFVKSGQLTDPVHVQSVRYPNELLNGGEIFTNIWCRDVYSVTVTIYARQYGRLVGTKTFEPRLDYDYRLNPKFGFNNYIFRLQ